MGFDALASLTLKAVTSSNTLGVTASYLFANGELQTDVEGVWNEQTETIDVQTDSIVTTQQPRFFVNLSNLTYKPRS